MPLGSMFVSPLPEAASPLLRNTPRRTPYVPIPRNAMNATAMPIDEAAPPLRGAPPPAPSFKGAAVVVTDAKDALGVITALPLPAVNNGDGGVMRGLAAVCDVTSARPEAAWRAGVTTTEGVGERDAVGVRVDVGVGEQDAELDLPGAGTGAVVSFRRGCGAEIEAAALPEAIAAIPAPATRE